jgi:hypothetical protein
MVYRNLIRLISIDSIVGVIEPRELTDIELTNYLERLLSYEQNYWNTFLISEVVCELYHRGQRPYKIIP